MSDAPEFFYSYKPKMMGPSLDVQLSKDALDWQIGPRTGRIAYPMIRHIRLGYKPTNMAGARFIAEIWPINETKLSLSSVSARSLLDIAPQNNEYVSFLRELHRRVAAAKGECVYEAGIPAWRWWPSMIVGMLALAAVFYIVIQAVFSGQHLVAGGIAVIGAWFLWQIWNIVIRNRPRRYPPDAIPADVLPS
jgi:hypothetical protein